MKNLNNICWYCGYEAHNSEFKIDPDNPEKEYAPCRYCDNYITRDRSAFIVVTRHKGMVDFLDEFLEGLQFLVLSHVDNVDQIKSKNVYGVLPLSLIPFTFSYIETAVNIPQEKRGKELSKEEVEKYFDGFYYTEVNRKKIE